MKMFQSLSVTLFNVLVHRYLKIKELKLNIVTEILQQHWSALYYVHRKKTKFFSLFLVLDFLILAVFSTVSSSSFILAVVTKAVFLEVKVLKNNSGSFNQVVVFIDYQTGYFAAVYKLKELNNWVISHKTVHTLNCVRVHLLGSVSLLIRLHFNS